MIDEFDAASAVPVPPLQALERDITDMLESHRLVVVILDSWFLDALLEAQRVVEQHYVGAVGGLHAWLARSTREMSEACSRAKAAWDLVTAALNLREVAVADCMNDPYNIVVQWPYPIADPSAVATDEVQSLLESFASGANGAVTQLTVIQQCREKADELAYRFLQFLGLLKRRRCLTGSAKSEVEDVTNRLEHLMSEAYEGTTSADLQHSLQVIHDVAGPDTADVRHRSPCTSPMKAGDSADIPAH
jgi:hypothetical protein